MQAERNIPRILHQRLQQWTLYVEIIPSPRGVLMQRYDGHVGDVMVSGRTGEQAEQVVDAIANAERAVFDGARKHVIKAVHPLTAEWPASDEEQPFRPRHVVPDQGPTGHM